MLLKLYDKNNNPQDLQRIIDILNDGGFFLTRTLQLSVVNCFRWHRIDVKRQYVIRQDHISIFLVIICIVWTVTQECTAEDVGQKVKMLFIAMSVQLTGKAKGVTSMVFLRNILKPRSYRQFRE